MSPTPQPNHPHPTLITDHSLIVFPHGTGSPKGHSPMITTQPTKNPTRQRHTLIDLNPQIKPTPHTHNRVTNQPPDSESQPNTEWRTHHHPSTEDPNRMLGDDPDKVLHHRRTPLTATHSPTHFSYNLHPQRATHPTIHRNQMVHQV